MRTQLPLVLLAAALACSLFTAPAQAQRARTFVASYGTDAGNTTCSFTQPCRTFQNAVNNTATDGEVTAIDSAGFQPVTINHSITITSPSGVEAGIVPSPGGDAISILASSPVTVTLRGLTLEGNGTGSTGIDFVATAGGTLEIIDCMVKDFTANGIFVPSFTSNAKVVISHTTVLNNTGDGIQMNGNGNSAFIDNTIADSNNGNGINLNTTSIVALSNLHADSNNLSGINLANADVIVKNSEAIDNQGQTDLALNSTLGTLTLTNNNAFGFVNVATNGTGFSDGTNLIIHVTGSLGRIQLQ